MTKLTKIEFLTQLRIAKVVYKQTWSEERASVKAGLPVSKFGTLQGQWLAGILTACANPECNDAFDVYLLAEKAWETYCDMPDELTDATWAGSEWSKFPPRTPRFPKQTA